MKRSFLMALFFLGIFIVNFAAQADFGNPSSYSALNARCHREHVIESTWLDMKIRLSNWNKCVKWGLGQSSLEQNRERRRILTEDYTKSTNAEEKEILSEAIRAIPPDPVQQQTAEAIFSAGVNQ